MANERTIDVRNPIPHWQWEEAYQNAGFSGNAVYEGNGYITYRVKASREDLEAIANECSQTFKGVRSEIKGDFPILTARELLDDPQSISEMFVQVNIATGVTSAIIRIDNPMVLDDPVGVIHFGLNETEKDDAERVVRAASREFNNVMREKGVDINKIEHGWDGRLGTNLNYFNEHFEIAMGEINKKLKTLDEMQGYYDEQHIERARDEFYSNTRKTIDDLWNSYLKVVPDPDKKQVKEFNKTVYNELAAMGEDTDFSFKDLGWKAYKRAERADRSFLTTLKEFGGKLLTSLHDIGKSFLDGALNIAKNIGDNVKQAEEKVKALACEAREKLGAARDDAAQWLFDRVDNLKERAADAREAVSNKTAAVRSAIAEKGSSFIGRIADGLNNASARLSEKSRDILDAPRHDFDRLHNAEGFKSIDPNYSSVKTEATPFFKALGMRVDRDDNGYVAGIVYTPRLNKDELAEVVSRSNDTIGGKTLVEWLEDPDVNVELSVSVPVEGTLPAMAFVSDRNGEEIGCAYVELTSVENEQIAQVAKEVGGKAVLIDDIAELIYGEKFNESNADNWVPALKKCSFEELHNIVSSLSAMRSQEARDGWAMGYLARTEPAKTAKPEKKNKSDVER